MLKLNGAWLCGLSSVPQGSGLSRLRSSSIMVGMFVSLCLASQKPSEREFLVPARTDLAVELLSHFHVALFQLSTPT